MIYLYPAFKKRFAGVSGFFTIGPTLETSNIENTPGRFINIYGHGENEAIFEQKYFAGTKIGLSLTI
jgi:hypothetical protein